MYCMCSEKKLLHQISIGEVTSELVRKPVYDDINIAERSHTPPAFLFSPSHLFYHHKVVAISSDTIFIHRVPRFECGLQQAKGRIYQEPNPSHIPSTVSREFSLKNLWHTCHTIRGISHLSHEDNGACTTMCHSAETTNILHKPMPRHYLP